MGKSPRRVVICGQSIFAMVVEMTLTQLSGVDVTRLDPHLPGAIDRVAALAPDVVMIERGGGQGDLALALLGMGIPLIELDGERKRATALAGRRLPAVGIEDLARTIEHLVSHRQAVERDP